MEQPRVADGKQIIMEEKTEDLDTINAKII